MMSVMVNINFRLKVINSLHERLLSQEAQFDSELEEVIELYIKENHAAGVEVAKTSVMFSLPTDEYYATLCRHYGFSYQYDPTLVGSIKIAVFDNHYSDDETPFDTHFLLPLDFVERFVSQKV